MLTHGMLSEGPVSISVSIAIIPRSCALPRVPDLICFTFNDRADITVHTLQECVALLLEVLDFGASRIARVAHLDLQ